MEKLLGVVCPLLILYIALVTLLFVLLYMTGHKMQTCRSWHFSGNKKKNQWAVEAAGAAKWGRWGLEKGIKVTKFY